MLYLSTITPQPRGQWTLVSLHVSLCEPSSSRFIFMPQSHVISPLGHASLWSSFPLLFIRCPQRLHSTSTSGQWRTWPVTSFTFMSSLQPLHFTLTFSSNRSAKMFRQNPIRGWRHLWHLSLACFFMISEQWPQIEWPHGLVVCGFTIAYVLQQTQENTVSRCLY